MPSWWFTTVACFLTLVEQHRRWPPEWLQAYVAMVPKSSGGTRPQDQRPITVPELVYRFRVKGTITPGSHSPVLFLLSDAATSFRSKRGTLQAAQVVADLVEHCRRENSEL